MYLYILSCHSKKRPQAKTDPKDEIIKKADIEQMSTKCNQECSHFCALISKVIAFLRYGIEKGFQVVFQLDGVL